jgi:hypothetical protein
MIAVTFRQFDGLALIVLGAASIAFTRWPDTRLARLVLSFPFGRPPDGGTRAVRIARYCIFSGVVLFGAWLATGH